MIVVGAGGQAVEILELLLRDVAPERLCFFDDRTPVAELPDFCGYEVVRDAETLEAVLAADPRFVLGLGGPEHRRHFHELCLGLGGEAVTLISDTARLGQIDVEVGAGATLMDGTWVSSRTQVGVGVLVNQGASLHHDVRVGAWVEVGPGARLLGRARAETGASVGGGAVILPGRSIGEGAVVGAGAVVTNDVPPGERWAGVPARPLPPRD